MSAELEKEMQLEHQRSVDQAAAEGHDADIPSSAGYVLDDREELKRKESIANQKSSSLGRSCSRESDPEKQAPGRDGDAVELKGDDIKDEAGASEDQANIVFWDSDDDSENPFNWPTWKKTVNCGLISGLTFITPLASCERITIPTRTPATR